MSIAWPNCRQLFLAARSSRPSLRRRPFGRPNHSRCASLPVRFARATPSRIRSFVIAASNSARTLMRCKKAATHRRRRIGRAARDRDEGDIALAEELGQLHQMLEGAPGTNESKNQDRDVVAATDAVEHMLEARSIGLVELRTGGLMNSATIVQRRRSASRRRSSSWPSRSCRPFEARRARRAQRGTARPRSGSTRPSPTDLIDWVL